MSHKILGSLIIGIILLAGCQKGGKQQENDKENQFKNQQETPDAQQQPMPGQMGQQEDIEVTDKEIQKFVAAVRKIQNINRDIQQEMNKAVKDEGMTPKRFNEIQRGQQQGQQQGQVDATEKEMQQYQKIIKKIQTVQTGAQKEMQNAIEASGLSQQRYQQIANAARGDTMLMKRIQNELRSGMTNQ